jgi:hypothetical protein
MKPPSSWTQWGVALAVVAVAGTVGARAQSTGFDRRPWLEDYAALKQAIETRYANLAWFASPEGGVDLPALDRRTLAALQSAASDEDGRSAVLNFVRSFRDGHFSPLASLAPAARVAVVRPSNPTYAREDPTNGCAALGYAVSADTTFSESFEAVSGFHLVSDGLSQPFRAGWLTLDGQAGRLGVVRIPEFESTHPSLCLAAWGQTDVWDAQGHFVRGALRRAMEQRWYQGLADLLQTFKAQGVAAVLVDVGNNSGGDDSGDIAARLFTGAALHSSPLWMAQDETTAAPYFDEQLTALANALRLDPTSGSLVTPAVSTFTTQKAALGVAICPMAWVWRERRPWQDQSCRRLTAAGSAGGPLADWPQGTVADPRVARVLHWPMLIAPLWGTWTGPLYVLTNNHTYSAAEMFAAVLQNNHAATMIGGLTGGDGCGFMNTPDPLVLPNSHLRFRLPNCVRMRADGTDEVAGVTPDLPVLPTEGEAARPRAVRLLTTLFADLATRHPR